MSFIDDTIARIDRRMALERKWLAVVIREWRAEHLPGMRQCRRDAVRQSIRAVRIDMANAAHWRAKYL